jgi:hypothetical protein
VTVKRGEHGNIHCILHSPQVLKVLVGPGRLLRIGRVARGLGEGVVMAFGVEKSGDLFPHDILLIQRTENECGSSCIFELVNHTDIIGHGP